MRLCSIVAAAALLVTSLPAQAQVVGVWRVNGTISGRAFALNCRFEQRGGVCVNAADARQSHTLTSLSFSEGQARWGFETKVLFASIAMAFDGKIQGDRMNGVVTAAGRTGSFTAVRG